MLFLANTFCLDLSALGYNLRIFKLIWWPAQSGSRFVAFENIRGTMVNKLTVSMSKKLFSQGCRPAPRPMANGTSHVSK